MTHTTEYFVLCNKLQSRFHGNDEVITVRPERAKQYNDPVTAKKDNEALRSFGLEVRRVRSTLIIY